MEEVREGPDARFQELVDEAVVEVEAGCVDGAGRARDDARPGDREAEGVEPELPHQRDVLRIAVVEVARDLAVVAGADLAGRRAEPVPDALAASVLGRRPFDLVGRGGRTPDEVGWEVVIHGRSFHSAAR